MMPNPFINRTCPARQAGSRRISQTLTSQTPARCSSTASHSQIAKTKPMRITTPLAIALLLFGASFSSLADTAVHKCVVNGTVTFQQDPCPSTAPRKDPDVDRLNVKEKEKRRLDSANTSTSAIARTASSASLNTASQKKESSVVPPPPATSASFRCDGRTHCSQMTSCSEAKFFLANCPRVKMDGDRNGTPCEQQWCNK
jgi:hypothetical protein